MRYNIPRTLCRRLAYPPSDTGALLSRQKPYTPLQTSPCPSSQSVWRTESKVSGICLSLWCPILIYRRSTITTYIPCRPCCHTNPSRYRTSKTRFDSHRSSQTLWRPIPRPYRRLLEASWNAESISILQRSHASWTSICVLELAPD